MLVVGPNSTCDICTESYMSAAVIPHVIPCGHIFCRTCLNRMQVASLQNLVLRPQCPICRNEFSHRDIHQLRVDSGGPSSTTAAPQVDTQAQRLLDDIEKIVDGRATVEEIQRVLDLCDGYHSSHPGGSLLIPLGVSHRLLTSFLEAQRKLFELASTKDDIRDRLLIHLEFAQTQYRTLEQIQRSEKETALRNEEAGRARYDEMNARWRSKVESMMHKCQSLCEELDLLRQTNQTARDGDASTVVQRRNSAVPRRTIVAGGVTPRSDRGQVVFTVIAASVGCVLFLHAWLRAK